MLIDLIRKAKLEIKEDYLNNPRTNNKEGWEDALTYLTQMELFQISQNLLSDNFGDYKLTEKRDSMRGIPEIKGVTFLENLYTITNPTNPLKIQLATRSNGSSNYRYANLVMLGFKIDDNEYAKNLEYQKIINSIASKMGVKTTYKEVTSNEKILSYEVNLLECPIFIERLMIPNINNLMLANKACQQYTYEQNQKIEDTVIRLLRL